MLLRATLHCSVYMDPWIRSPQSVFPKGLSTILLIRPKRTPLSPALSACPALLTPPLCVRGSHLWEEEASVTVSWVSLRGKQQDGAGTEGAPESRSRRCRFPRWKRERRGSFEAQQEEAFKRIIKNINNCAGSFHRAGWCESEHPSGRGQL